MKDKKEDTKWKIAIHLVHSQSDLQNILIEMHKNRYSWQLNSLDNYLTTNNDTIKAEKIIRKYVFYLFIHLTDPAVTGLASFDFLPW